MGLATVVRDEESAPFFEAAAKGRLLLRYSPSSQEWSDPAAQFCSVTQAADLQWKEASGHGVLVSWTVKPGRVRDHTTTPDVVIGLVELEEGPWMSMWFPNGDSTRMSASASVKVEFFTPEEGEAQPVGTLV